jgi:hypothetical protein
LLLEAILQNLARNCTHKMVTESYGGSGLELPSSRIQRRVVRI